MSASLVSVVDLSSVPLVLLRSVRRDTSPLSHYLVALRAGVEAERGELEDQMVTSHGPAAHNVG